MPDLNQGNSMETLWEFRDLYGLHPIHWPPRQVLIDVIRATTETEMDNIAGVSSLRAFRIIRLTRRLERCKNHGGRGSN